MYVPTNYIIIYQREALQMLEMMKHKALQLAYKQVRYGFTKKSPYISYGVYYLYWQITYSCYCTVPMSSHLYMLVTTKAFLIATTRQKWMRIYNISITLDSSRIHEYYYNNKLIFFYLKTRRCKFYTLKIIYIINYHTNKIHENLILTKWTKIPYSTNC